MITKKLNGRDTVSLEEKLAAHLLDCFLGGSSMVPNDDLLSSMMIDYGLRMITTDGIQWSFIRVTWK